MDKRIKSSKPSRKPSSGKNTNLILPVVVGLAMIGCLGAVIYMFLIEHPMSKDDLAVVDRGVAIVTGLKTDDVADKDSFVSNGCILNVAEKEDANVAKEAFDGSLTSMRSSSTDISAAQDPLKVIDDGTQKLYENNVPATTPVAADLTPEHIILIKRKMSELFTSNVDYIKNSAVGKYNNTYLRMTNNLYNDGTDSMELLRTKKAVAVVGIIDQVKKAEKEKGFGQIVKGLNVYGIKVVRPKELYVIKAH